MKRWQILCQTKDNDILKTLLSNRGLKTKKEIEEFLNPSTPYSLLSTSLGIKTLELKKAIARIKKAIDQKEQIIVYGDYDCDGVCATAVAWLALNSLGAKVMPYIPHRVEEGYGLSKKGIDTVKNDYDAKLIITVDHGITAAEKVGYGKKLGIDFIICDHHVLPEKLPKAVAIVHTTKICGAGVSWVLARELLKSVDLTPVPLLKGEGAAAGEVGEKLLDLVGMATIADMMPLLGPNRSLVKYGLEELNQTIRPGLKALIKVAGLKEGNLGVYDVSHILAPRLNAMGRLEHAMDSLRLLCTNDEKRAKDLAELLNKTNKERQSLTEENLIHAKGLYHINGDRLIFLAHESYNPGVIGLVAGKLVEEFYRPVIVVACAKDYCKASARSINGFNIVETIKKASDLLVDVGGHPMAAGFTVETKNLEKLQKRLTEIVRTELTDDKLVRTLKIDCELPLEKITLDLYNQLQQLGPFGFGNPEPVFCATDVVIEDTRIVGQDRKHLKLSVIASPDVTSGRGNLHVFSAVAFNMADLLPQLTPDKPVSVAYSLSLNTWNNQQKLELKIKDILIKQ